MTAVKRPPLKPLLLTSPHSGEAVPDEAPWLSVLPETLLMFDVDRYVDQLYQPVIDKWHISFVKAEWHRYAVDLNRLAEDVDADSVVGHANPPGKFPRGLHWSITTTRQKLMPKPMPSAVHEILVQKYFEPFHRQVQSQLEALRQAGAKTTYHIDLHSMPSVGTSEHLDPGEHRKDIVIGDREGKSCSSDFKDLVTNQYARAGFKVGYNWPYKGGRLTEFYGQPAKNQHTIQVELSRGLYMDEKTKQKIPSKFAEVQKKLAVAIEGIYAALPNITLQ